MVLQIVSVVWGLIYLFTLLFCGDFWANVQKAQWNELKLIAKRSLKFALFEILPTKKKNNKIFVYDTLRPTAALDPRTTIGSEPTSVKRWASLNYIVFVYANLSFQNMFYEYFFMSDRFASCNIGPHWVSLKWKAMFLKKKTVLVELIRDGDLPHISLQVHSI